MFYEFKQNNSGGHFVVNDKLCNRVVIEAENEYEAIDKAEELGCYWYGVQEGLDCPCCGDRWNKDYLDAINLKSINERGFSVSTYDGSLSKWKKKYGTYEVVEAPAITNGWFGKKCEGKIKFRTLEEYMQFLANEYGCTTPDVRIYYKNGNIKEIFKEKTK